MGVILSVLLDTLDDVAKLIPFLFATYLFLEWMEHQTSGKMERFMERHRRTAPLAGSLFGLLPECGMSSAACSLYATGIISAGTLIAVFLSTSDEMLPILISAQAGWNRILPILAVKLIVACLAGYLADCFCRRPHTDIESFCQREHCDCEGGILHSALQHTLQITLWLAMITLLMNGLVEWIGMDSIRAFVQAHPSQAVLSATLVGMIPSCASSIVLSTLYLDHIISFAAVCAGLLANAGVGMMVLFRVNPHQKDNLKIVGYVWLVSLISGLLLERLA